jgi:hypothetical protein
MSDDEPDVPGERRVTCSGCGWDGGTYSFTTTTEPSFCPGCGLPVDDERVSVTPPDNEPTALTWTDGW